MIKPPTQTPGDTLPPYFPRVQKPDVSGLAGIKSIAHLLSILKQHFAPASLVQPPAATLSNRGNRQTAITTSNQGAPTDSAAIHLSNGGRIDWTFTTVFKKAPIINVTPVGASPSGKPLYISNVSPNGVVVFSEDGADTRLVHLSAVGNPD